MNDTVMRAAGGERAQRFGSIERVTAERHGTIRVGTPGELRGTADLRRARPCPEGRRGAARTANGTEPGTGRDRPA
ncbi:hypothetical protein QMZ92_10895 [Streptomyces sp. HNM0645]|uniref:hypothetical protein n=1 Tax=Streptomyces sp. HNM0645 TaxID=2782343 RepID=UPI0024B847E5|nr:hypothetical protein [Streptomyces sp. HNM0645]MDI9884884.1 hypothetical protein [Streptomyces sp. HNM0645]